MRYRFLQKTSGWRVSPRCPKTRKLGQGASAYLQGVTLIQTTETTLNRHMPLARDRCSKRAIGMAAIAAIAAIPMSGCASAPSIGVLGAYFPDWLFCIVAGVVLTVVIYLIIKRLQADHLTWNALILSTRNR